MSMLVALIGLVASLFLAVRGLRGFRLGTGQIVAMAVFWGALILFLGFILGRSI